MRWSHNVYALAEVLAGKPLPWEAGRLLEILEETFGTRAEHLFVPDPARPTLLDIFDRPEFASKTYATVEQALAVLDPATRAQIEKLIRRNPEGLRRVIPHLIDIEDAYIRPPGAARPARGTSIAEYKSGGPFVKDGADYLDPVQGTLRDCYLIASLIALAWSDPAGWRRRLDETGLHQPDRSPTQPFRWRFHGPGRRRSQLRVTTHVPFDARDRPAFTRSSDSDESWPALLEKAYAMYLSSMPEGNPNYRQYRKLDNAVYPWRVLKELTGGTEGHCDDQLDADETLAQTIRSLCHRRLRRARHPIVAWTKKERLTEGRTFAASITGLRQEHAYAVLGSIENRDSQYVALRDPHGRVNFVREQHFEGEWRVGSGASAVTLVFDKNTAAKQGLFAVPGKWLGLYFQAVDWVEG